MILGQRKPEEARSIAHKHVAGLVTLVFSCHSFYIEMKRVTMLGVIYISSP